MGKKSGIVTTEKKCKNIGDQSDMRVTTQVRRNIYREKKVLVGKDEETTRLVYGLLLGPSSKADSRLWAPSSPDSLRGPKARSSGDICNEKVCRADGRWGVGLGI